MKTAEEMISPFVYGNYDNPDEASGLPEGDYIEESKCLMVIKDFAQQEREKAVREFKERLINDSDDYVEVFTLLRNVKYQTEREETQEYKMCFEMDLPKIIKGYLIEKLK